MFNRREFLRNTAAAAAVRPTTALVALSTIPILTGCNGNAIAQDIVNWTPALESTAATAAATASILLPADAIIIAAALAAFNAGANLVSAEAKAYLANPGQTTLQALQTAVITLQQQVTASLLNAAKIVDPKSQTVVTAAINGVATVINSILSLITQIKGNTVSATTAAVKLSMLPRSNDNYWQSVDIISKHYDVSKQIAIKMLSVGENQIQAEGF